MRVLLNECVPRPLRRELRGHTVWTVTEMGWADKKNGQLLQLISSAAFEVFVTVDQNLEYQQNLKALGITTLVLVARTNRLVDLRPLAPDMRAAIATIKPGDFVIVGALR